MIWLSLYTIGRPLYGHDVHKCSYYDRVFSLNNMCSDWETAWDEALGRSEDGHLVSRLSQLKRRSKAAKCPPIPPNRAVDWLNDVPILNHAMCNIIPSFDTS